MLNCVSLILALPHFLVNPKHRTSSFQSMNHRREYFFFFHLFSGDGARFTQASHLRVSIRARASLLGFISCHIFSYGKSIVSVQKASHFTLWFVYLANGTAVSFVEPLQSVTELCCIVRRAFGLKSGWISPFDIRESFMLHLMTLRSWHNCTFRFLIRILT